MNPGQLFDLPANVYLLPGHIGVVKDNSGNPSAKYEVVVIDGQLKARIMVTYENTRRKRLVIIKTRENITPNNTILRLNRGKNDEMD